jgi:fatty acid amide hydrolase|tara:strand:- start:227 stop:586 length:360 start_codon:yes stop_codon:yes gene_type:complete
MLKKVTNEKFERLMKHRQDFVNQVSLKWQRQGLSALISPVFPTCAYKNEHADELSMLNEYTVLWNVIGFPCGTVPITKVQEEEQNYKDHYEDRLTYVLNESCNESFDMPISLQVIGYAH